jgi:hypothetical protein
MLTFLNGYQLLLLECRRHHFLQRKNPDPNHDIWEFWDAPVD